MAEPARALDADAEMIVSVLSAVAIAPTSVLALACNVVRGRLSD
jgi:hypothetical protein